MRGLFRYVGGLLAALSLLSAGVAETQAFRPGRAPGIGRGFGFSPGSTPILASLRVVPVSATEAYVVAPHATLGAIALHLLKGNGTDVSTPGDSVGAPFGDWRIQGYRALPAVTSNPATQSTEILSSGIGSQEIAIRRTTGGGWAGQYHGLGSTAVYSQTAPDLTVAGYISSAVFTSTGRAKWSDGAYYDFTNTITLNGDGSISTTTNVVMPFDPNIAHLDMTIVSPTFTRASLDGGATYVDLTTLSTDFGTMAANVSSIIMRNPTTGRTVTIADDALNGTAGRNKIIMRRSGDFKVYPDLNPTPNPTNLGNVTVNRTITFGQTAPDPVSFTPYSWSGQTDGAALGTKYTLPFGTQNYSFDNTNKKIILTRGGAATGDTRVLFGPFYPATPGAAFTAPFVFEVAGGSPSAGTSSSWTRNADGSSNGAAGPNAAAGTVNFTVPAGENGPIYILWRQPQASGSDNILRILSAGPQQ